MRIVILGGGFGGVYAALELEKALARDGSLEVTLVARENFFLFTPMLHEVAASDLDMTHIVNPIRKLLRRVKFVQGEVESVDLGRRRVLVAHGGEHHDHELEYDHLVIALGAVTDFYDLPGVEEHAFPRIWSSSAHCARPSPRTRRPGRPRRSGAGRSRRRPPGEPTVLPARPRASAALGEKAADHRLRLVIGAFPDVPVSHDALVVDQQRGRPGPHAEALPDREVVVLHDGIEDRELLRRGGDAVVP